MSGLINQLTIQYHLDDPPDQARTAWKQSPPRWMAGFQLLDEREKVELTTAWFDFVFFKERVAKFLKGLGLLDQVPDPGTRRVQAVIKARLHIQKGRFGGQVAGQLVLRLKYRR